MNDIYITLTGNVAAEPRQYSFDDGTRITSLKVLTSHRYFDKKSGQWTDGDKVCFTVRCWRALGENVAASVRAGHPVVVSGKLRIREFGPEGDRRFMPEVEASAVGHDLRWGSGVFTKPDRGGGVGTMSKEMRERLDEETRDWAMASRNLRGRTRAEATAAAVLGTGRALGVENDTRLALEAEGGAVRTLRAEGDTPRVLGAESDTMRALGAEGDTVRILGAEGDETVRAEGDDGKDRDAEQMTLEERAAA
ncbi:single-stranded DNA-binding protein [Nonomuraea sp. M3C6]|uniref:Single-stranded DNA-binding protein n=1 Tax=Nonomuraea marmarensis TaxID=3351344 RepID=A0ABW7ACZ2_9ACTN